MTNYEKALELQESNDFAMRSCWECNPAHGHLKDVGGLYYCIMCDRWFMNGGYFDDEHCEREFIERPPLEVVKIEIRTSNVSD